jgi:hypothetical protein
MDQAGVNLVDGGMPHNSGYNNPGSLRGAQLPAISTGADLHGDLTKGGDYHV